MFGSYLRESNNRVEQVEKTLSVLQQEIRERTDELKQVLSTEFQASIDNLEKKLKSIVLKDEQEKFDLQQKLEILELTSKYIQILQKAFLMYHFLEIKSMI